MKTFFFTYNFRSYFYNGKRLYCDGHLMSKFSIICLIEIIDFEHSWFILYDAHTYKDVIVCLLSVLKENNIGVSIK